MKDAMESAVLGGTKWKKFALVMVPTMGIAGAMVVATAQGALATSINVSGQAFQISAGSLHGDTFYQTGSVIKDKSGKPHAVAVAGIKSADITNMCQSVKVPLGPLGNLVVVLKAGGSKPAHADNLVIFTDSIKGDAVFGTAKGSTEPGVNIGVDASDLNQVTGFNGVAGAFGQSVQSADLTNVQQVAYSTTATTLSLSGMSIDASFNGATCF